MSAAASYPPLPPSASDLALPAFAIGHGSDRVGMTGVTVVLCPQGVTAAAEVRGSATATRQFDSLVVGHHVAARAHALVFAGGSAFGLAAADPVVEWLATRGHGFQTPAGVVPTVPTAILFDLAFGDSTARPRRELVEAALAEAHRGEIAVGSVGAGTGATVGKALGPPQGMKGGFGFARLTVPGGVTVAAAVAVNAAGDVCDPASGHIVAGCRAAPDSLELLDARRVMAALPADTSHPWEADQSREPAASGDVAARPPAGGNTTLAAVLTDGALSKPALLKVCQMAFGGLYRTLAPALTLYDGDLVVALASGERRAHPHQVGVLAEEAVARAVLVAVRAADGFGLLPAVRDLTQRS
ncbi:MAG TPA: P1 family peptidase [Thermoanaerobaculia bacterium]|nr:P1 family peptidase [Thermoanaerobaculia bacterium]